MKQVLDALLPQRESEKKKTFPFLLEACLTFIETPNKKYCKINKTKQNFKYDQTILSITGVQIFKINY